MVEILLLAAVIVLMSIAYGMTNQHKELIGEVRALRKQVELTFTPDFEYNDEIDKVTDNGHDSHIKRIYQLLESQLEKEE